MTLGAGGLLEATAAPPVVSPSGAAEKPWRFIAGWVLGWALVGIAVGLVIVVFQATMSRESLRSISMFGTIVQLSVLFAEVVGLTALSSSRLIFPYFMALPYLPRLLLQIASVGGAACFGTLVVSLMYPLYSINNFRLILMMALVNGTLALVVSIAVNTYESMKRQLERTYVELRKKEAFEREMEIAREVQEQLFPKSVPRVRGMEIAGVCLPAAGVGGDYYDYLPLSDERVGLVVADVSGKGISAALLMASLQASVRSVIGPKTSPCEANVRLNEILYHSTTASRYATLFLGLFDGRDSTFRYSNAGHNPPMMLCRGGPRGSARGACRSGSSRASATSRGGRSSSRGTCSCSTPTGRSRPPTPAAASTASSGCSPCCSTTGRARSARADRADGPRGPGWTQGAAQQDDITIVLARAVEDR